MVAAGFVTMSPAQAAIADVVVSGRCGTGSETTNFIVINNQRNTPVSGTLSGEPGAVPAGSFNVPAHSTKEFPLAKTFGIGRVTVGSDFDIAVLASCVDPAIVTSSTSTTTTTTTPGATTTTSTTVAGGTTTTTSSTTTNHHGAARRPQAGPAPGGEGVTPGTSATARRPATPTPRSSTATHRRHAHHR